MVAAGGLFFPLPKTDVYSFPLAGTTNYIIAVAATTVEATKYCQKMNDYRTEKEKTTTKQNITRLSFLLIPGSIDIYHRLDCSIIITI